jgi:hypothetical protein
MLAERHNIVQINYPLYPERESAYQRYMEDLLRKSQNLELVYGQLVSRRKRGSVLQRLIETKDDRKRVNQGLQLFPLIKKQLWEMHPVTISPKFKEKALEHKVINVRAILDNPVRRFILTRGAFHDFRECFFQQPDESDKLRDGIYLHKTSVVIYPKMIS